MLEHRHRWGATSTAGTDGAGDVVVAGVSRTNRVVRRGVTVPPEDSKDPIDTLSGSWIDGTAMTWSADEHRTLRRIADYQFGEGAGHALIPAAGDLTVRRSTSGRPRQVIAPDGRLVTLGTDGRFTLGFAGGRRLATALSPPSFRVVVGDESEPFVRDGSNVFAKFVRDVDPDTRAGDEVLVVHRDGSLLGVGRAELPADAMCDFETGMAVKVRDGAGAED